MNILDKIVIQKKNHYKYLVQKIKKNKFKENNKPIFFKTIQNELKKNKNALIVEFKRFSPSVNNFKKIKYLQEVIRQYDESKCCCISILTDKNFGGSLNDILIAKKITSKPIIRKDFIINKAQILESKIYGADAILLIAKILTKKENLKLCSGWYGANLLKNPVKEEIQSDGRIKLWAFIEEESKFLRVILLEDRLTVHNAFFDRRFKNES